MFPKVDAAILVDEGILNCNELAKRIKYIRRQVAVVYLHGSVGARCKLADHDLSSHEPEAVRDLVRSLSGDPRAWVDARERASGRQKKLRSQTQEIQSR